MASTSSAKTVTPRKRAYLDSFGLPIEAKAQFIRKNIHVAIPRQLCRYLDINEDHTLFRLYVVQHGIFLEISDKRSAVLE